MIRQTMYIQYCIIWIVFLKIYIIDWLDLRKNFIILGKGYGSLIKVLFFSNSSKLFDDIFFVICDIYKCGYVLVTKSTLWCRQHIVCLDDECYWKKKKERKKSDHLSNAIVWTDGYSINETIEWPSHL